MASARQAALEVLNRVFEHDSYSNIELNHVLKRASLSPPDKRLTTELVYGTIQRLNTLDWHIQKFVNRPLKKLDSWVLQLLRMSFYQIIFLERIPNHAVVHEAVELAKEKGNKGIASFFNGVLRTVTRHKEKLILDGIEDEVKWISLKVSHPEWLVRKWIKRFGREETIKMCEINNNPPPIILRVNTLKTTREELIDLLNGEGIRAVPSQLSRDGVRILSHLSPGELDIFRKGWATIQDESSMLVADAVNPRPGDQVLDACSAPGGKATHLAQRMGDKGEILAVDIHPHKESLIRENGDRLGIHIIHTMVADSTRLGELMPHDHYDRVLLDAPCSGLGVLRRKPEIKWKKTAKDTEELIHIQRNLLKAIAPLVKKGETLVYSTCTIDKNENEEQIAWFLEEHPDYERDETLIHDLPKPVSPYVKGGCVQILPHYFGSDGFFISRVVKR